MTDWIMVGLAIAGAWLIIAAVAFAETIIDWIRQD